MDASSAESLERGYLQVAEVCGLESRVSVVQRWLSNISEPWALILDNADDPRLDISSYFPRGNRGVVLITTRNPDCKVHATVGSYELGAMVTGEAVTLLLRTAGTDDMSNRSIREAAESVVLTLGGLALAITQAGAVIRQGYCKMEEYRTLYSRGRKKLLSQKAIQGGEDYRYTVYTTWEVSRRMIEEMSSEAGQDALALLQMFSFIHYEGISEEIFCRAWRGLYNDRPSDWMISHQLKMLLRQSDQEWNVYPLRAAISILRAFSLIYRDKNGLISIHPLVHSWTRDQMIASDEDMVWRQTTAIIALSIPWTFETTDYRFRQSMMPHIDACLGFREDGVFSLQNIGEDCQTMAGNFALVYSEVGRRQEALQLTERVVEVRKRTLGEDHSDTLGSMHNLAISYSEVGQGQEALQLTERVVEVYKRTLGEEHPDTLGSMHALAIRYSEAGRRQEALQLTERVVEVYKRTLGEEHPDTLGSMHALAIRYSKAGRRQEALQLTERVVEVRKRTLGEEHPDTLGSMHNLAIRYSEAGRRQEALQLTGRVLEVRKRTLGEEHPDTLGSMHSLAIRYSKAGRRQEALQLTERVVEVRKRTLGEEHPDTLGSMHNLAIRYSEAGRRQEALQLTERVLEVRKRTLGEEHPETLGSMHNLAIRYSEAGRRQEALQLTGRVLEVRKRTLGEEHPETLGSMHNLAIRYSEAGRRQEALQLTGRVLEVRKRTLGEEHPETIASTYTLTNLEKSPQNTTNSYRQPFNSENKSCTQHPNGRNTKPYDSFARFWKKLT
ncbi:hypothetical protein OEA41_007446 [Lepraria neglecta]|uniref:Kinesin light chain n=1 Tax=Lepraria neglecta TaxID=209136 RepID=A0AAD9ZGC1_9LECA|nr:hypothetical protein OEA41_007446 [Lepraria neglecta]